MQSKCLSAIRAANLIFVFERNHSPERKFVPICQKLPREIKPLCGTADSFELNNSFQRSPARRRGSTKPQILTTMWVFGIAAEFGAATEKAEEFVVRFMEEGKIFPSIRGRAFADGEGNWWAHITMGGVATAQESAWEARLTEVAIRLGMFRFALAGVETDEFRTYSELVEDIEQERFPGLVLSRATWNDLGQPPGFIGFSEGFLIDMGLR